MMRPRAEECFRFSKIIPLRNIKHYVVEFWRMNIYLFSFKILWKEVWHSVYVEKLWFYYEIFMLGKGSVTVRVLKFLQAPFVPPRKLIVAMPKAITVTLEHSLPPLRLNRSHRTNHMTLEGGDSSLNFHGLMILHRNRFLLCASPT